MYIDPLTLVALPSWQCRRASKADTGASLLREGLRSEQSVNESSALATDSSHCCCKSGFLQYCGTASESEGIAVKGGTSSQYLGPHGGSVIKLRSFVHFVGVKSGKQHIACFYQDKKYRPIPANDEAFYSSRMMPHPKVRNSNGLYVGLKLFSLCQIVTVTACILNTA